MVGGNSSKRLREAWAVIKYIVRTRIVNVIKNSGCFKKETIILDLLLVKTASIFVQVMINYYLFNI